MGIRNFYIGNTNAPEYLELFLISGVTSVLGIRAFLALTGYPQIGGDGLHIAHMLWGGLFMTLALLLLLSSLGQAAQRFAAILAGVGFGTFIDELGKFITSDNDYFYQPTIGLIYIIFIAIFLTLKAINRRKTVSPDVALANAVNRLELSVDGKLNVETRRETLELLRMADATNPLVLALRSYVQNAPVDSGSDANLYISARDAVFGLYRRIALHRWFTSALILLFVAFAVVQLAVTLLLILASFAFDVQDAKLTITEWILAGSASVSSVMVAVGVWRSRHSRFSMLRWFQRAVLVSIFVTQVFSFFLVEFSALFGLVLDILIYSALDLMIRREQDAAFSVHVPNV